MNYLKTFKKLAILMLLLQVSACENTSKINNKIADVATVKPLTIDVDAIKVEGDLGNFKLDKTQRTEAEGLQIITFKFTAKTPSELQSVLIKFNFPSLSINGFWNSQIGIDKVNYYSSGFSAKASSNAPVLAFYDNGLNNRITIALSDALNKSSFVSYLREEDVHFYPQIRLFGEKMPKTTSYEIELRIDTRSIPYYKAVDAVADWWAKKPSYKPMQVPVDAKKPMYSTWYSYHQSMTAKEIAAEAKIASSLGCGAVIVDDGWQTNDGNRGYAYTGDWNPDRIGDMKAFVDAVHAENMKFILWYSLPFMGEKAKNYSKFKGKYLTYWKSQGTYVMDPRYPEVREYIVNTYIRAMNDWKLDGFKLDFIGRFTATGTTKLTKENGRDYASVNEATDALMTEITNRLTAIKPDVLIEFRQPYIGPLMRKYGNMFRGVDAPNNAVANKVETTNLRIMAQHTAVHSDMFIWRPEETVEQAALQILNILYSVPQLSVKLKDIPEDHLAMIRYWFAYWNANKDVLLDGDFIPSDPGANYPMLTAIKNGHQITTVYQDMLVSVHESVTKLDIINAKASKMVVFNLSADFDGKAVVFDCTGKVVYTKQVSFDAGVHSLQVPPSGMVTLAKD